MPNMPNVSFKQGLQENLNKSTTQKVAGAFYLTTDTNRLYYCDGTSFKDLNQYIHSVATINNLPAEDTLTASNNGDFYYIEDRNILCRFDNSQATGYKWVQINPDSYLDANSSTLSVATNADTNTSQVSLSISDTGNHTVSKNFTLKGGSNVHLSSNGTEITIAADNDTTNTTYDLGTANNPGVGTITLTSSDPQEVTPDTITLTGSGDVSVSSDNAGNITITGAPGISGVSNAFSDQGAFVTTISRNSSTPVSSTAITPTITYGVGQGNKLNATFNVDANVNSGAPTAALSIYTQAEVDSKIADAIRVADAMTFKGVLSSSNSLPTSGVKNGDTYKLSEAHSGVSGSKAGDLIIATGTEDSATGSIPSGSISWTLVESGNDQFIVGAASAQSNLLTLTDRTNSNAQVGSIAISAGADIAVSSTVGNNNALTVNVAHATAANMTGTAITYPASDDSDSNVIVQQSATSVYVPAFTAFSIDDYGHITHYELKKYKIVDTHATLNDIGFASQAQGNTEVDFVGTIKLDNDPNNTKTFSQKITSSSLVLTAPTVNGNNNAGVNIDLVWGEF